ncbi:MAG: yecD, partial [Acidimicrobiales bacterium]|nr:yecD [Acidimicrobiales bacterium]
MPEAIALVTVDVHTEPHPRLVGLTAAFRRAGLPVIHTVGRALASELLPAAGEPVDHELLRAGGVQTLGPSEMAIALRGGNAFDATPLDALLRALVVETIVVGGAPSSVAVSASVRAGELRGYRALLATDELAVTLGAHV